jgi:hypothetical protein
MNVNDLIAALDLPSSSRVNQRVPKKLLIENGAPTTADKRYINEGIEELEWVAALKPSTVGVPEYRDESREYLEVAVLKLTLRDGAKTTRLVELVHRAIPYPVLLVTEQGKQAGLSAVHKRWSQGEAGKTVLDGELVSVLCDAERDNELWPSFRDALKLDRQARVNLHALYQGWINTLLALNAARIKGRFAVAADGEHAVVREEALRECSRLNSEIVRLRASAKKERQVAKQVELNLELKRVEAQLAQAKERL